MYKKILLIMMLFLLTGCDANSANQLNSEELQSLRTEIIDIQNKYIELDNFVIKLSNDLESKENEIILNNTKIDNLKRRIRNLEVSNDKQSRELLIQYYQDSQRDYLINFSVDIVKNLDGYSKVRGILTKFDEENGVVEIDVLEYIPENDKQRIEELGIDTDTELIIAGGYIYNAPNDDRVFSLNEKIKVYLHQIGDPGEIIERTSSDLITKLTDTPNLPFTFDIYNDEVIRITEDYHN